VNASVWFDGWAAVWCALAVGTAACAAPVLLLRISGQRTLSKMNAFDFVVTAALGSTLATVLLSKVVAFVQGAAALVVLIGLKNGSFSVRRHAESSSDRFELVPAAR